jgi:LmbE family N-acetylglucosaminyl deacetylase
VCTGVQTMGFKPTDYVDITSVKEQKRNAVYCHASQNTTELYKDSDCNHGMMEKFRGMEMSVPVAEAFVRMDNSLNFSV